MRAARLIKMVLLLQSRPAMTAAELAAELEVSERTVTRDAQALSEAGVPVYAERGRAGGYRLIGGYRTRLTGLARNEAEALFLSGLPSALREMGLEDAASAARLKVSAALLPSVRDASASAAQRFHLDAPSWYHEPEPPDLLPAVADAVWDDRLLRARYRRGGGREHGREGTEVARELAPYGLVLKAGVWYLCARAGEDFRVYRIDRFTSVDPCDERFDRDESFDLPAFWEERAAEFARSLLRTEVTVRVSESGARQLAYAGDRAAAATALSEAPPAGPDGWRTVVLPVESLDVAYSQLLSLGPELEVVAPEELRSRFAETVERLSDLYR
ncbi:MULTISPECIES: helix-turn-helix transcriptional regulator [unclassified Streptomyces]|uniref:helix-turn-helix transcriptional regulator n=1 Tax=unclassified Streptomyces TaxID=2593676 RepID=UPI00081DC5F0|nr:MULTISPECIES: WYL domain-containing protein [unclassified Streptomyces]MYR92382.1 WYL domain-containing protein [Streptomyces sp. SID4937]SCD32794.1 Predicted DNA-binding transcriptional regulator YafY, contains an HTH and WYL domains [Streptomyces sp. ScaeMP-e83]